MEDVHFAYGWREKKRLRYQILYPVNLYNPANPVLSLRTLRIPSFAVFAWNLIFGKTKNRLRYRTRFLITQSLNPLIMVQGLAIWIARKLLAIPLCAFEAKAIPGMLSFSANHRPKGTVLLSLCPLWLGKKY